MSTEHDETERAVAPRMLTRAATKPPSEDQTPVPRRGGRLTEKRREEIIRKSAALFLDNGYEHVTMDQIVAELGGSKATVYGHFGGKAGLFKTVMEEHCRAVTRDITLKLDVAGPLEEQLAEIGRTFLHLIISKRTIQLHRLIISLGNEFPSLTEAFFQAGPNAAYQSVAKWMTRQQRAGIIKSSDPNLLAALYLDMLRGRLQLACLTGTHPHPASEDVETTVKTAARIFAEGIAVKPTEDSTKGAAEKKAQR